MMSAVRGENPFVFGLFSADCDFSFLPRGRIVSRARLHAAYKPPTYIPYRRAGFVGTLWCLSGGVWAVLDIQYFQDVEYF